MSLLCDIHGVCGLFRQVSQSGEVPTHDGGAGRSGDLYPDEQL